MSSVVTLTVSDRLLSETSTEDEKKAVLQEYVDRIGIQPSKDINNFDA